MAAIGFDGARLVEDGITADDLCDLLAWLQVQMHTPRPASLASIAEDFRAYRFLSEGTPA